MEMAELYPTLLLRRMKSCPASVNELAEADLADRVLHQVFLFVNPASGGGRATDYLNALGTGAPVKFKSEQAELRCYNMLDGESGVKPGFLKVSEAIQRIEDDHASVRVLVAGGDGTVMWAISELSKVGCDMTRVAIGHIPFGTGNDFSRSTGWGPKAPSNLIGNNLEFLRADLRKWLDADVIDFDVWEVDVTTTVDGGFLFVHGPQGTDKALTEMDKLKHGLEELPCGGWRMCKPMVNYFSLGQTCRAGLGFEKKRTKSRVGNFARYGWEGMKKLAVRPAPLISDVVEEFSVCDDIAGADDTMKTKGSDGTQSTGLSETSPTSASLEGECCSCASSGTFATACSTYTDSAPDVVNQRTAELLFLNVPSFAAGADPWTWACQYEENLQGQLQDVGDGKLEVISYSSGMNAMIDAANGKLWLPGRGTGKRLASAPGPFVSHFKPPSEAKYTSANGKVYFQIDGEFFVVTQPQQATVRHLQTVRVLRGPNVAGSNTLRRAATSMMSKMSSMGSSRLHAC